MLTGLKESSLACKCVFYGPEHNAKWGQFGIEFWRSWNAEMKKNNGYHLSSYHVTPTVMVLKMLKTAHSSCLVLKIAKN